MKKGKKKWRKMWKKKGRKKKKKGKGDKGERDGTLYRKYEENIVDKNR